MAFEFSDGIVWDFPERFGVMTREDFSKLFVGSIVISCFVLIFLYVCMGKCVIFIDVIKRCVLVFFLYNEIKLIIMHEITEPITNITNI